MTLEMSKAHFDNTLESVLAVSVCGIVFAAMWIIILLVQIESSKVSFFSVDHDHNSLDLQVEETTDNNNNNNGMEVERPPSSVNREPDIKQRRGRRVSSGFKMMQLGSVIILILLTYLLLVTSNAPIWLSALGSFSVFGMFLRFQIGDEVRRQRWDRLALMMSLFLLIAAFLNLSTYAWKSLAQGEVYMGPARIVGFDGESYNNTNQHDPTTRADLMVQWGKDWGCPFTGGKICQAHVQGVMCSVKSDGNRLLQTTTNPTTNNNSTNSNPANHTGWSSSGGSSSSNATENSVPEENNDNDLEKENNDLQQENDLLEEEVEELKEQNDEQEDEEIDTEEVIEDEMVGDEYYDAEEIIDVEEDEEEAEADVDEMEEEMDKDDIEDEIKDATDDSVKEELEKDVDLVDEEIDETESDLDVEEDEYEEIEDEYSDTADEYYDEADSELDAEIDEIMDEEITDEEIDETEQELNGGNSASVTDDWYYEELDLDYDDDMYESEYWDYDWDSAWGDYGCTDLFDEDMSGKTYDASVPAGGEDDWPYINIYGSCKTCDAYIMDYFAEEAFEQLDDYFLQSVMYLVLTFFGMAVSLIGFIKYKIAPPAENQMELLGSDGGVIA